MISIYSWEREIGQNKKHYESYVPTIKILTFASWQGTFQCKALISLNHEIGLLYVKQRQYVLTNT